jgi:hypothetical protein
MKTAKTAPTPARIVTVSTPEWNRHRQKVIAKRNEPAVGAPRVTVDAEREPDLIRALVTLMSSGMKAQLIEERLFRRIEERFQKNQEASTKSDHPFGPGR